MNAQIGTSACQNNIALKITSLSWRGIKGCAKLRDRDNRMELNLKIDSPESYRQYWLASTCDKVFTLDELKGCEYTEEEEGDD